MRSWCPTTPCSWGGTRLFGPTADVVNEENIRAYYQVDARVVDVSVEGRRMQTVFPFALA